MGGVGSNYIVVTFGRGSNYIVVTFGRGSNHIVVTFGRGSNYIVATFGRGSNYIVDSCWLMVDSFKRRLRTFLICPEVGTHPMKLAAKIQYVPLQNYLKWSYTAHFPT